MASLNKKSGSIVARCPGCDGGKSTFEWVVDGKPFGAVTKRFHNSRFGARSHLVDYRLFRCAGCGVGAWAAVAYKDGDKYPGAYNELLGFYPETGYRIPLPEGIPEGIRKEFREAEDCFFHGCNRASSGLFRSVLDKTLRANGYKTRKSDSLYSQIEAAANDGVITQARKKKAHDDIRVLGNDVLHDEWIEIGDESVSLAQHYCQRILEDFYDDRKTILSLLAKAGRTPVEESRPPE